MRKRTFESSKEIYWTYWQTFTDVLGCIEYYTYGQYTVQQVDSISRWNDLISIETMNMIHWIILRT